MKLIIIDNYDSFTYNLVQLVKQAGIIDVSIVKNDILFVSDLIQFDKIIFSPGPGTPEDSPVMFEILQVYQESKSILGVCLGHQAIGCFYGGKISNLARAFHGKSTQLCDVDVNESLFDGIRDFNVGRYHSWVLDASTLPECLKITSTSEDGHVMSLAHKAYDIKGVQFHPESFITGDGLVMMKNWLKSG